MPTPNLSSITTWLNANQGLLALLLFVSTILGGWASGIFAALRRRPKFQIELIPGPTFVCTFGAPNTGDHEFVHRTGIALYLHVANIGSAPSSINGAKVGYRWSLIPLSKDWWRHTIGWFWLETQTVCLADFQADMGGPLKLYPFLTQTSFISGQSANSYLQVR
jgi:hypothetical protein